MTENFMRAMTPEEATQRIRDIANTPGYDLDWTGTAEAKLGERNLIISDVHHVLSKGEVVEPAKNSSAPGFYKYVMECRTPNSPNQNIRLLVIPSKSLYIKLCDVL